MVLRTLNSGTKNTNEFDSSSDEESNTSENVTPFQVDWLDLAFAGCCAELIGISSLPGLRFRDTRRNLQEDIDHLKHINIKDIFIFCTSTELQRYRVPHLMDEYVAAGIEVHFYPLEDGMVPAMEDCINILDELKECIKNGHKTVLHCVAGIGRSCLVAASLLLYLDETVSPDTVISKLSQLRGPGSIHAVKHYNFVHEFREMHQEYTQRNMSLKAAGPRSASR